MSIKQDYIEVENILNKDGEQTISLTGDQGIVISGTITSTVSSGTGRIRSGGTGQLHLGDDSDIISVGRTNELWCMADIDSDQTLYVNYRGYNNAATRFRSFDIRDGKGAQIAHFNASDKKSSFTGEVECISLDVNGVADISGLLNSAEAEILNLDARILQNDEGSNKNRLLFPGGASYNGSGTETGAIKIKLPTTWTNTMMKMKVRVFDYAQNESFDVNLAGYTYTGGGGSWINTSAWIDSQADLDRNFTVRFGYANSCCTIYIGELDSTWAYLKVNVVDVMLNHSGTTGAWATGTWAISLEASAFAAVTQSRTNTQVNSWKRDGTQLSLAGGASSAVVSGLFQSGGVTVGSSSLYSATGGGDTLASFTGTGNDRQDIVVSNQTNHADAAACLVLATHGHDYMIKGTSSAGGSILTLGHNTTHFLSLTSSQATFLGEVEAASLDINGNADISGTLNLSGQTTISVAGNDAYTPTAFNDKSVLVLRSPNADTNYTGIQFSNTTGNYEWFIGTNQVGSNFADMVFQGYDRSAGAYKEYLRISDNGDTNFVGTVTSAGFVGRLQGAVTGAPDATIWCVSGQYTDWGIFYDENTPDVIQFKAGGTTKATISLDNGDYTGRNLTLTGEVEGASLDINGNADISGYATLGNTVVINTASDSKMTLQTPSGDTNDWNYINFKGRDGVRDAYFGTTNNGTPSWYRDDGGANITLEDGYVNSNKRLNVQGELEATSLDINGVANISGSISGLNGSLTTTANYFQLNTPSGNIQIGAMNADHAHMYTDRADFYFNKAISINGANVLTAVPNHSGGLITSGTVAASRVATLNQNTTGTAAGLTGITSHGVVTGQSEGGGITTLAPNGSASNLFLRSRGTGTAQNPAAAAPTFSTVAYADLSGTVPTFNQNTTGTATGLTGLTASRVMVSAGNGTSSISPISTTKLGYLSGVTSSIQTQLNAKQATLTFGISNTNSLRANDSLADDDFLRVNGSSIEGRTAAEVLSDIGAQGTLTFGIGNTHSLRANASLADNDFLRVDGSLIEGRTAAQTLSDIGAAAALGNDDNYVTDSEKTVIGNTSGTNSGDVCSSNHTGAGYLTSVTVPDNHITNARLAGITKGSIIYGGNAGNPAYLAISSTAGHVLSVDSNGQLEWAAQSGGSSYSLPTATSSAIGGVKIGFTTNAGNRNYAVQINSAQMYVNVPWTADTNTQRAAGNGMALDGNNMDLDINGQSGVTASMRDTMFVIDDPNDTGANAIAKLSLYNMMNKMTDGAQNYTGCITTNNGSSPANANSAVKIAVKVDGTNGAMQTHANGLQVKVHSNLGINSSGIGLNPDLTVVDTIYNAGLDIGYASNAMHIDFGSATAQGSIYGYTNTVIKYEWTYEGVFRSAGTQTLNYQSWSDKRLKENVQDLDYGLDSIMKLKPVSFDWKDKYALLGKKQDIGFIAQDVEKVMPKLVTESEGSAIFEDEDGVPTKSVDYVKMVAVLTKAIQEQQKQIDELKRLINGNS